MEPSTANEISFQEYEALSLGCFPHFQPSRQWHEWYNLSCPMGQKRNYIIRDEGRLIANLGALPLKVKIGSSVVEGGLLTSGMVHPKYRGRNLFVALENYLIEQEREIGTKILVGIPNPKIFRSHLKAGMDVLCNLDFIGKYKFQTIGQCAEPIEGFSQSFDPMLERLGQELALGFIKDHNYLNWRYFERPDRSYKVFAVFGEEGPRGFVVISQFDDGIYKKTHIVDIVAEDDNAFAQLVKSAEMVAMDSHELNTWQIKNSVYQDRFARLGFVSTLNKSLLISKLLVDSIRYPTGGKWWMVLGDNDVY